MASFRASCMRKARRPQGLNVGRLYITSTKVVFTASYLNVAPHDANVKIELSEVHQACRACYKKLLPHSVLIKCRRGPDYLMAMTSPQQQDQLMAVLDKVLQLLPRPKRTVKDALARLASDSSGDRANFGAEREPARVKGIPLSKSSPDRTSPKSSDDTTQGGSSGKLQALLPRLRRRIRSDEGTQVHREESGDASLSDGRLKTVTSANKETYIQRNATGDDTPKSFNFATDITSEKVELTLSVPIPNVSPVAQHVRSFRSAESLFFLLATAFLLVTTYGILSSVRMMTFRLAIIKELVSQM